MSRYKLGDISNEEFYMLPKSLFKNPRFSDIGVASKVVYAILKDRMNLSAKNGWSEDNGDIFFLFGQEDLATISCMSISTIQRCMGELKRVGLIETARQGLGKPDKIYLNKLEQWWDKKPQNDVSVDTNMMGQETSKMGTNNTERSKTKKSKTENSKSNGEPFPFDLVADDEIRELLMELREVRKIKKAAQTVGAEKQVLNKLEKLSQGNRELKKELLGEAISNSWKTVFPLKSSSTRDKPRYDPMNPSGSRYTEKELDDLNLPF